ncbi:MAG: retropepsin-like aspartic protease, partial [Candidatus Zixiibacteriota bacterium]
MLKSILALILTVFGASTHAATLAEILDKHAEVMGGWEKISKVTSAVVKAETELGGMKGTTVTYFKAPDMFRVDLNIPIMNYTQACAGDNCWIRDQLGLVHSLGGDLKGLVVTQMALDRGTYLRPDRFDGAVTLLDSNIDVSGADCYQIEIAPTGGSPALLAIDASSYLIKRVKLITDMAVVYSYPDDYRLVDGLMMPYKSTEATDAGIVSGVNTIQEIEFNVALPDSLFVPGEPAVLNLSGVDVVVPFELYRNHIYFDAEVPGQGTLRFIFDSGAGGVGLNSDLVEKLSLKKLGEVEARGVGGADVSQVYQLDSLNIGGLEIGGVPVYAMDLAPLQAAGTKRIDGIIGYELLSRYAITVDYEHQYLIIRRNAQPQKEEWGSECRLNLDFRLPYIDARINESVIGRFRLDTGSGSTIDFNSPFVERNNLLAEDRSGYHQVMAFG